MPPTCSARSDAAGVFHGLAAGYRWSPAVRAIQEPSSSRVSSARSAACAPRSCSTTRPTRTSRSCGGSGGVAGGGVAIDTGYHLVDCARFLVGEIEAIQGLSATFIGDRRVPSSDAVGNRGAGSGEAGRAATGTVDVEDAAAALVTFAGGAYGVLDEPGRDGTARLASARGVRVAWLGRLGPRAAGRVPGLPARRGGDVRVPAGARQPTHPGAAELLIAGTDGTSIGWLGIQVRLGRVPDRSPRAVRPRRLRDGVRDNAVIDALYASATSGARTPVVLPVP